MSDDEDIPCICAVPIGQAIVENDVKRLRSILSNGGDRTINLVYPHDVTLMELAVRRGNIEIIQLLLDHNADINQCTVSTPLHYAIFLEDIDVAEYLLQKGADINALNVNRHPPLCIALDNDFIDGVKLLLDHGADETLVCPLLREKLEWLRD